MGRSEPKARSATARGRALSSSFRWPRHSKIASHHERAPAVTASTVILVVDDEPQIQRFLKPSLEAAGYRPIMVTSGREALRLIATRAPDVVVLDLGLPDMDGKDVIKAVREWSQV